MTGFDIAEDGFKPVMLAESDKIVRKCTFALFEHLGDNGLGVIEPDFRRHASDMLEDCDKTLEQTFLIFSLRHLEISFIAIRKGHIYIFAAAEPTIFIVFSITKIR